MFRKKVALPVLQLNIVKNSLIVHRIGSVNMALLIHSDRLLPLSLAVDYFAREINIAHRKQTSIVILLFFRHLRSAEADQYCIASRWISKWVYRFMFPRERQKKNGTI